MKKIESTDRHIQHTVISVAPKTMILAAVIGLVIVGFWQVRDLILVVLAAVVLSAFVESLSSPLRKLRMPRVPSVLTVYLLLFVVFGGVIYLVLPTFVNEVRGLVLVLPEEGFIRTIVQLFGDFANAKEALSTISDGDTAALFSEARSIIGSVSNDLFQTVSSAFGGLLNLVLIIVISLYLAVQERGIEKFLQAVTPIHREAYVISLWRRTERKIGLWFRGQLLSALLIAVLTYVGLVLLGVEYAFLLSLVAGIFGLIPFGIFVATIPAVIVAFLSGGVQLGLLVLGLYIVLQQIEEYVFHPFIINKVTGVPSLMILLSLIIGAKLAGFLGIFLGLPAAIMLIELVTDYEAHKLKQMEAGIQ